jgi:integrase
MKTTSSTTAAGPVDSLDAGRKRIDRLHEEAKNHNTERAHASDLAHFNAWCAAKGVVSMPATPETVELYLEALFSGAAPRAAGARGALKKGRWSIKTIERRRATIGVAHTKDGFGGDANPAHDRRIGRLLRDMRLRVGTAQARKDALLPEDFRSVATTMAAHADPREARDLALVLVGFTLAMRRSELVGIDHEHLRIEPKGVRVWLPKQKNDKEAKGTWRGASRLGGALCPVRALEAWIAWTGHATGPVFLGLDAHRIAGKRLDASEVSLAVKRMAERAGMDPDAFGGHSLRRGFVTAADRAGKSLSTIMRQTGHRTEKMVRVYTADDIDWARNPDRGLL